MKRHAGHPQSLPGGGHVKKQPPAKHHLLPAQTVVNQHIGTLRNSLMQRGYDPASAAHLARAILSQPGVKLGQKLVYYKGQKFTPEAFAKTRLVDWATGDLAKRQNQSAIRGDAGYMQALAQLGLNRDTSYAGLDDQRRRAILQFGDPSFAGNDALLGGQARSNPFSTSNLLNQQYEAQKRQAAQASNQAGTIFGGGYQSGQQGVAHQNALSQSEATQSLSDLLSSLSQQRALSGQSYGIGQQAASMDATQRLLQAGSLHATAAPHLGIGAFRYRNPVTRKVRLI